MQTKTNTLEQVLAGLMGRYKTRVPDVSKILTAMVQHQIIASEHDIENDHIAFRTLEVPHLGIQSLEKIFLHYGYTKMDYYYFAEKKLDAYWYAPPDNRYPRIFISQLRVKDLSEKAQGIIRQYTDEVQSDPVTALNLDDAAQVDNFLHSPLWRTPAFEDYLALSRENEYAAWTIYNRYYLNHFTISVHNLKAGYNTVALFNTFLESIGVRLNTAGGKIKTSGDGLLLQSSTVAQMVKATFAGDAEEDIAGSYVEFAERKPLPGVAAGSEVPRHQRREGFETANADKIFESTYTTQTDKK
jgi:hypothetical protein